MTDLTIYLGSLELAEERPRAKLIGRVRGWHRPAGETGDDDGGTA